MPTNVAATWPSADDGRTTPAGRGDQAGQQEPSRAATTSAAVRERARLLTAGLKRRPSQWSVTG